MHVLSAVLSGICYRRQPPTGGPGSAARAASDLPTLTERLTCAWRADDWGYGDTAVYNTLLQQGIDQPATPRLTKMAAEGTTYTNFHTLGAECSPSRASWMTGRSPSVRENALFTTSS